MLTGIDMGASATKLAVVENGKVILTHDEPARGADIPALCERLKADRKSVV